MAIKIITDSTADYEKNELQAKDIICVPMSITFNEQTYLDGIELNKDTFFEKLAQENVFPSTSQPSPEAFAKHFEAAQATQDTVIVIVISSALSGTYQSAHIAKEMVGYEAVHIIDSLTATIGIKFLVDKAVAMRAAHEDALTIVNTLEALKSKLCIYAAMDTLEYLYKGGRLSKAQAGLGTLAHLKPIITITSEGTISIVSKSIGLAKARSQILKLTSGTAIDSNYPLHMIYAYDPSNCHKLKEKLEQEGYLIQPEHIYGIGPTIGTHIGAGAFGIVFIKQ